MENYTNRVFPKVEYKGQNIENGNLSGHLKNAIFFFLIQNLPLFALLISKDTEEEDEASDLRRVQSQAMGLDPGPVLQQGKWMIKA